MLAYRVHKHKYDALNKMDNLEILRREDTFILRKWCMYVTAKFEWF